MRRRSAAPYLSHDDEHDASVIISRERSIPNAECVITTSLRIRYAFTTLSKHGCIRSALRSPRLNPSGEDSWMRLECSRTVKMIGQ